MIKIVRKCLEEQRAKNIIWGCGFISYINVQVIEKILEGQTDEEILAAKRDPKFQENSIKKHKISQILMRDSSYIQSELAESLAETGVQITQSGVSRNLKSMGYTKKRLVKVLEERNSSRVIDTRQSYASEVTHLNDGNLVFLDETGVNLNQTRNYGYSPKNVKALRW